MKSTSMWMGVLNKQTLKMMGVPNKKSAINPNLKQRETRTTLLWNSKSTMETFSATRLVSQETLQVKLLMISNFWRPSRTNWRINRQIHQWSWNLLPNPTSISPKKLNMWNPVLASDLPPRKLRPGPLPPEQASSLALKKQRLKKQCRSNKYRQKPANNSRKAKKKR